MTRAKASNWIIVAACLVSASPAWAGEQFSLTASQVGFDDESVDGLCASDACRATLPVAIDDDVCVLNIRVGAPPPHDVGRVIFALGPCRSGRQLFIKDGGFDDTYSVDRLGAATHYFALPYSPTRSRSPMDDGTRYGVLGIRLDIIATGHDVLDRPARGAQRI